MTLTANQEKSKMKRKSWKMEGDTGKTEVVSPQGNPLNNTTLITEFG
jgi:hypothetical protein